MRRLGILLWSVLLLLSPPGASGAVTGLEDLPYRVSLGVWEEVAQVHLTLKELGPGHYLAEFSGGTKGMWSLLSRWLPERYQTEMILRDGRLLPLVYREEIQVEGRHVVKEYRFDYQKGLLAYWRQTENQESVKKWQIPLKEPVYDSLSLFYNMRLGVFGPLPGGETLKVQTIPTPEPQEMIIDLGPQTGQGRKVMLTIRGKSADWGPYFIYVGPEWVPRTAWLRVLEFGKLTGSLLNPAAIRTLSQLGLAKPRMAGNEPRN
jgi:hypothetical protein